MPVGPGRVSVEVDISKVLMEAFTSWQGPIGRSATRFAKMATDFAKLEAPKSTGRLMGSIKYKKLAGPKGIAFEVTATARHALWMEHGTKPHVIRPKKPGGLLVFYWAKMGRKVFLRSVNHPGTKPHRYLEKGLSRAYKIWKVTG